MSEIPFKLAESLLADLVESRITRQQRQPQPVIS